MTQFWTMGYIEVKVTFTILTINVYIQSTAVRSQSFHFWVTVEDGRAGGWVAKNLPANAGGAELILGQEDPLQKEMGTHSSILASEILWTEEPGGLQSIGLPKSWTGLSDWTAKQIEEPQETWIQSHFLNLSCLLISNTCFGLYVNILHSFEPLRFEGLFCYSN